MATSESDVLEVNSSKFENLPYPLSELENKPRCTFLAGEIGHYMFFWTCAGAIAGIGVGFASFYRQHRYRIWVRKQPLAAQLKLLEKNNPMTTAGQSSPGLAITRFSTLPKAIDTRMKLPYSSDYKPYQWYEWGPLKLWNNFGDYPWASSLFIEVGKWSIRLSLLCGATLAFESSLCSLFGFPLGTNQYIRATAGLCTGYLVAKIASEGVLFWYQTLGIAVGLGALWAGATLYNPNWGQLARDNQFVIEMYSKGLHKSVKKYYNSKEITKQLYEKDKREKCEIYEEFLKVKQEELRRKGKAKINEYVHVDNVDLVSAGTSASMRDMEKHWLTRYFFRRKHVEISKEIDEMPYEERKKLEQKTLGDAIAVNYQRYPFKLLAKKAPQFFSMDADRIREQSDTAKLVNTMSMEDHAKPNAFDQKQQNKIDLSILS